MSQYVGIQTQIRRNNIRSLWLLFSFPILLMGLFWAIVFALVFNQLRNISYTNERFLYLVPFIVAGVGLWFIIAYFFHNKMILNATSSQPLERSENKRVYNLVENLCIAQGMTMPRVYIIYDDSLNAFASGINEKTFSVTLSQGIIDKLDDRELEAVIAHELTHIQNRDTRLLIISIIFVGIFAFIAEMAMRSTRRVKSKKDGGLIIIAIILISAIAYLISILIRFSISRKREYMADAGAAEMTKNPEALANALRKIADDPYIEAVTRKDVAQLFIENPGEKSWFEKIFSTHPPIKKRIAYLEKV